MLDVEDRKLEVPDFSAPDAMISTPKIWVGRNARDFAALTSASPPPPVATREFRRTDRLLIKFTVTVPSGTPTVTAQLLNQAGTKMVDVPVTDATTIDLPLANLAAGQYLLEVTAKGEGDKPVIELIAFRLGS